MSISRYNSEGYPDPTTYGALSNIEQQTKAARAYRPMVYVCSPFSGDVAGNIANARKYSRFAVEQGYIPIAPHLLFPQFLNDTLPSVIITPTTFRAVRTGSSYPCIRTKESVQHQPHIVMVSIE